MKPSSFETQVINENILDRLSLEKRFTFLNNNLTNILEPNEKEFLLEVERFCIEVEKKADHRKDLYEWYPLFGKMGYICRVHSFEEINMAQEPYGLAADLVRHFGLEFFDPQFNWSVDASVLCVNPLHEHHDDIGIRIRALKELITGNAVGCVCITEPERGSDATHQLTIGKKTENGIIVNGVKAFNTNAPKSKYGILYAAEEQNNPKTLSQSLIQFPAEGIKVERIYIPFAPRVYLGKETFTNYLVTPDRVMGDVGKGRTHMFEGLVLERVGIAMLNITESWNAITHATIYSNLREQMGKKIIEHQGVGFTLADLWAKTCNLTRAAFDICRKYDAIRLKYKNQIPSDIQKSFVTSASQLKYDCARSNTMIVYECVNLMGGAGVCDNTLMPDLMGVSRVQEIVGGTRQIQQYILTGAIQSLFESDK